MERILPLVVDTLMDASNLLLGFLTSGASLLAPAQPLLRFRKPFCSLLSMFGVFNALPVAISHEIPDTHIQPNRSILCRQGLKPTIA